MHSPSDRGIVIGDLFYQLATPVITEQPEARSLSLDATLRVFVTAFGRRAVTGYFRPDEKFVRTVSESRNADGGVHFDRLDGAQLRVHFQMNPPGHRRHAPVIDDEEHVPAGRREIGFS